ncbi:hypothetical protein KTAU_08630 [Thermogemmatispora aurantia]|uniref:Uncharacterized protein n=2 Tax=Thermogemmatispora aurantia TaxID=2045279 RepID=A0A5J4K3S9_9CHLR|nr:hypothetical protein KTAU_08630 [Thermogemmatispora aurantia]
MHNREARMAMAISTPAAPPSQQLRKTLLFQRRCERKNKRLKIITATIRFFQVSCGSALFRTFDQMLPAAVSRRPARKPPVLRSRPL